MSKKVISLLLVLMMVLTMFPVALADETAGSVYGIKDGVENAAGDGFGLPEILQEVGLNGNLPMLTSANHIKKALFPKPACSLQKRAGCVQINVQVYLFSSSSSERHALRSAISFEYLPL